MNNKNSTHNIGVGLRPPHFKHFHDTVPDIVSWVEVISENFMNWRSLETPAALKRLLKIREKVSVSLHGVSLSLGSVDVPDKCYLKELKNLIQIVQPESVSDHLCWTGVGGINSHDLLPLPYTEEAIRVTVENINIAQDYLKRQIAVENLSSYVMFSSSEMSEWEFVAEVLKRSGCRLILDVNNIYVSAVNHKFSPEEYINYIKLDSVEHIHLAGHTAKDDGYLIDTHDEPISNNVWELYRKVARLIPNPKVMIERDGNIPEWSVLQEELFLIEKIHQEVQDEKIK